MDRKKKVQYRQRKRLCVRHKTHTRTHILYIYIFREINEWAKKDKDRKRKRDGTYEESEKESVCKLERY